MVSNAVRFDPLLVRYLAGELNARLGGRGCAAAPTFGADGSVLLPLDRNEHLRLDLHPARGFVRILPSEPDPDFEAEAVIEEVAAPADERLLIVRIRDLGRFASPRRELVVELHTNQWNAILVGENGRIVSVLRARTAGDRALFTGQPYVAPPRAPRLGVDPIDREAALEAWTELAGVPPSERRAFLISRFAYTGTINADWILSGGAEAGIDDRARGSESKRRGPRAGGEDGGFETAGNDGGPWTGDKGRSPETEGNDRVTSDRMTFDVRSSFDRWWWIRGLPDSRPVVLRLGGRLQPYPLELAGIPAIRVESLLEVMAHIASGVGGEVSEERPRRSSLDEVTAFVETRVRAAIRRLERLREEFADRDRAAALRHQADLLLANLHRIRKGESEAHIEDWDGRQVRIPLDPLLTPAENATRLYEQARRRERAAAKIPGLITAAEAELERWREAARSIERGDVPAWIEEMLRAAAVGQAAGRRGVDANRGPSLPYRLFRTSGGLEVRVGKGAKENDRLTFGESSPNDVWLHARSVPGSHVVLRWPRADESPPARDLLEAAQLAAFFSRARTSSTVAVDWTRRKYVRKPRGAPPGRVVIERGKTLFVEPDERLVERLAVSAAPPEGRGGQA